MREEDRIRNLMMLDYSQLIMYASSLEELNDINHKEIEKLKQERQAIKKYVHNHTITYYTDNGIEYCKPDEYFNISFVEDMLNGNFENLDVLFEDSDKE